MATKRVDQSGEASEIDLGALPSLVGYALRRAQIAVFADFYATFAPVDLRPAEYSTLLVIHRNPGLRQGQVADILGIQPPNFAVLLDRLVARSLAERRESASDRRAVALHLTPAGDALLTQATELQRSHEQHLVERLGAEGRTELLRLLSELTP